MKKALYPGTFDPFTKGHFDVLSRGLKLFDEITLLVAKPPAKKTLFTGKQRIEMIKALVGNDPRIKIELWENLTVDYARKHSIHYLIRGLRPTGDFEAEFQMATMNKNLFDDLETIFFTTGQDFYYVSSSLVKEVFLHGGDVSKFLNDEVYEIMKKFRKEWRS